MFKIKRKFISPFSIKARKYNLIKIGGKLDDISFIAAFIQRKKSESYIKNRTKIQENEETFVSKKGNKRDFDFSSRISIEEKLEHLREI